MTKPPTREECLVMGWTCLFHNLRRAVRAVTQVFDEHFEELGIKATQFTVLSILLHDEADPPTVTDLAASFVLEQSSLSRNLAVLERLGYVRLVPGEKDKRERVVTLTRAGRTIVGKGYPIWQRAQAAVSASLDGEIEGQLKTLRRVTRAAQSVRAGSGKNSRKNSASSR